MPEVCRCGNRVAGQDAGFACVRCGDRCCVACAFSLDALPHCRRCLDRVLDAAGASLQVQPRMPAPVDAERGEPGEPGRRWLVLVARDQPALYAHLMRAFARDDKVDVVVDRRRDVDRNPPGMAERLRTHGAAVIRRPVSGPA